MPFIFHYMTWYVDVPPFWGCSMYEGVAEIKSKDQIKSEDHKYVLQ